MLIFVFTINFFWTNIMLNQEDRVLSICQVAHIKVHTLWKFQSSHTWCCVIGRVFPDISEECLTLKIKALRSLETSGTSCATREYHIPQAAILSKTAAKTSNPTFINFLNNDSSHKTSLLNKKYYKAYRTCIFYMKIFSTVIEWTTKQCILLNGTDSVSVRLYRPKKQINIKVKRYTKYQSLHLRRLSTVNRGSFKCSRNHFIYDKCKTVQSFKLYLLLNSHLVRICTFANDWNVLETLREVILWNLFQFFHCILNDVINITKAPSLQCWFQWTDREKSSWSQVDSPLLSHCSLLRNPWPRVNGVLEHCREGEINCLFSFFRGVSFWPHP